MMCLCVERPLALRETLGPAPLRNDGAIDVFWLQRSLRHTRAVKTSQAIVGVHQ